MMRPLAARAAMAAATAAALLLASCGDPASSDVATPSAEAPTPAVASPAPAASAGVAEQADARPAGPDAPAFAVLYPGAEPSGAPTLAQGPAGPGGIVIFTTEATPDQVIDFYRQRAEAAGLTSINAMNQGDARGYSAGDGASGRGQLLSVVATPIDGVTSVQLDWSAGR